MTTTKAKSVNLSTFNEGLIGPLQKYTRFVVVKGQYFIRDTRSRYHGYEVVGIRARYLRRGDIQQMYDTDEMVLYKFREVSLLENQQYPTQSLSLMESFFELPVSEIEKAVQKGQHFPRMRETTISRTKTGVVLCLVLRKPNTDEFVYAFGMSLLRGGWAPVTSVEHRMNRYFGSKFDQFNPYKGYSLALRNLLFSDTYDFHVTGEVRQFYIEQYNAFVKQCAQYFQEPNLTPDRSF